MGLLSFEVHHVSLHPRWEDAGDGHERRSVGGLAEWDYGKKMTYAQSGGMEVVVELGSETKDSTVRWGFAKVGYQVVLGFIYVA